MPIIYKTAKELKSQQLERLFRSVGWVSANYPDRLVKAIRNSDTVISAWDNDILVGMINVLDDGELTAYAHYLLVDPEYQKMGIGAQLISFVKEKYKDYLYLILTSESDELIPFYKKAGFVVVNGASPMAIYNFGESKNY